MEMSAICAYPVTNSSPTREIRTLIFDLFGVLIAFDENSVYRRLAEYCRDSETAFLGMQGLVSTPDLITGRLTLTQIYQQLVTDHGLTLSYEAFHISWLTPYTTAMTGVASMLQELSGQYRLVLLSNVDGYYLKVVRELHRELDHFAVQLVSCELGVAKPSAEAFIAALQASDAKPSECYFVDDKAENVDAAKALGIRGHVFTTARVLREALVNEAGFMADKTGARSVLL